MFLFLINAINELLRLFFKWCITKQYYIFPQVNSPNLFVKSFPQTVCFASLLFNVIFEILNNFISNSM